MNLNIKERKFDIIVFLAVVLFIIIIIASSLFFFNPIRKFKSARDAERWSGASLILNAIKDYQGNNKGSLLEKMNGIYNDEWYMIVSGPMTSGCDDNNIFSDVEIYNDDYCIDISKLVEDGYLGNIPISPTGKTQWDEGVNNNHNGTGYALMLDEEGIIYIQACESENTSEILIFR